MDVVFLELANLLACELLCDPLWSSEDCCLSIEFWFELLFRKGVVRGELCEYVVDDVADVIYFW